ncbi:bacillithiol biosynthesis cysteine-adding enzyme BshC [Candidatus Acetothermia bacterium]|jgi:bacillithiol biosynthesis cysteine-adding enzyme BshC|nr:bacillithiol biosynthesis cysteine-adding enzyme BshC [Candidatus Acetothermia bacterium]MCI2427723.1 bacillithiol biosynthesis cysteine-adding enzyme BshC [Candidatus Acetothermia bacterium]
MSEQIDPQRLYLTNRLYLDYVDGKERASSLFTHSLAQFANLPHPQRRITDSHRRDLASRLAVYNEDLGAHAAAHDNVAALKNSDTLCVITGQQAGLLGGPVYTLYKIVTAIRLAKELQARFAIRVIPVFWLATDDHDLNEINYANFLQSDGEVGSVRFDWDLAGHPIAALPITDGVLQAYREFFAQSKPGTYLSLAKEFFAPQQNEDFCHWNGRIWAQLFSACGLVITTSTILSPLAGEFFHHALCSADKIRIKLEEAAHRLTTLGYTPALDSARAGRLYTFDPAGRRIRVQHPDRYQKIALAHPQRFSADVALRPLLVDYLFPIVAHVLGPGEITYHAMLKPLYQFFELSQPLIFPRKSYTVLAQEESALLSEYRIDAATIITGQLNVGDAFNRLVPSAERILFIRCRQEIEAALTPLLSYVEKIDPNLSRTWSQTSAAAIRGVDELEARALKAQMSKRGLTKGMLQQLWNLLLPKGRLQERVLPLAHFINHYGLGFSEKIFAQGAIDDFAHHIVVMGEKR